MHTLPLHYTVSASATEIRPYFLDLVKFGELHPYMTKVKKLDGNAYSIPEKLFVLGFIPMKPFYTARVFEQGTEIYYNLMYKKAWI
ncbi:MAG: hypothetical protein JWP12_3829 [Bacteroidetes bacterium]|nr:hypothetical protein [Bacteroidota bacterium]